METKLPRQAGTQLRVLKQLRQAPIRYRDLSSEQRGDLAVTIHKLRRNGYKIETKGGNYRLLEEQFTL